MQQLGLTDADKEKIETVMRLSQHDREFRKRMLLNPKTVLAEIGLEIPDGVAIVTYDVPRNSIGLVLPSPLFDD